MAHKVFGLLIVFAIIVSFGLMPLSGNVTTARAAYDGVGCAGFNAWAAANMPKPGVWGPINFDFTGEPAGSVITLTGYYIGIVVDGDYTPLSGAGTLTYTTNGGENEIQIGTHTNGGAYMTSASCISPEVPGDNRLFRDGRLNALTPNAPVVPYATDEGIVVYSSDNTGIVLDVTAAFLAANAGQNPLWEGSWLVNGQALPASFHLLPTGEYQFMIGPDADGDVYALVFDAMPPTQTTNISYNIYGSSPKW